MPATAVDQKSWDCRPCRGHSKDVIDLAWSPDSRFLISGSVDHCVIIWDMTTGMPAGLSRSVVCGRDPMTPWMQNYVPFDGLSFLFAVFLKRCSLYPVRQSVAPAVLTPWRHHPKGASFSTSETTRALFRASLGTHRTASLCPKAATGGQDNVTF